MKAKLLTTLLILITVMSFAQDQTTEHLNFKGVPIDGTLIEYVAKMKQNGFNHIATKDGIAYLNGEFAGYKDCSVGVSTLKQKDLVHKIVVVFPDKETWSMLFGNYSNLKEMLTEKYSNPSEVIEEFDGYSQPNDDRSKMYAVGSDRCKYHSIWQTDKGNIQLSISHKGYSSSFVTLAYFDKNNSDVMRESAINDL